MCGCWLYEPMVRSAHNASTLFHWIRDHCGLLAFVGCRLLWALAKDFCSSELNLSISNPTEKSCVVILICGLLEITVPCLVTYDPLIFGSMKPFVALAQNITGVRKTELQLSHSNFL